MILKKIAGWVLLSAPFIFMLSVAYIDGVLPLVIEAIIFGIVVTASIAVGLFLIIK